MDHLTKDSYDAIFDTCCRLVPGASITNEATIRVGDEPMPGLTVRRGDVALVIWWWVGSSAGYDGEDSWAYAILRNDVSGTSPRWTAACPRGSLAQEHGLGVDVGVVEGLTSVLYKAFGPVVLPAILVAMLAADANHSSEPSIMESARSTLRAVTYGATLASLRAIWRAAVTRGLHCSPTLMLAAAAMVTAELGTGWKRPVIEPGPGEDDLVCSPWRVCRSTSSQASTGLTFGPRPMPQPPATRPLGWQDVDGGAPLEDYQGFLGSGWAATGWIGGNRCFFRGGDLSGPRSSMHPGEPGTYALNEEGDIYEVLVKVDIQREDGLPELQLLPVSYNLAKSSPDLAIPTTREDWAVSEKEWPFG